MNATTIKAVHIRELRVCATSGAGNSSSGSTSGGLHYFLTDIQGSTRAVMNNNGTSSAIVARHDYLPFGIALGAYLIALKLPKLLAVLINYRLAQFIYLILYAGGGWFLIKQLLRWRAQSDSIDL